MYSLIKEITRQARKQHRCIWCTEPIHAQEKYIYECSSYDGHMQHFHWHPECRVVSERFFHEYGEEAFEPHAFKRGSTEERC
jgi:hypothetical protein